LAPNEPAHLDTRGQIYFALGRTNEALIDLNKSIAGGADNVGTFFARGQCLEAEQNAAAAIGDYRSALKSKVANDRDKELLEAAKSRLVALGAAANSP
jgi:tetratricopeptide (TPR) repeat protein